MKLPVIDTIMCSHVPMCFYDMFQDEYIKAYYSALMERQRAQEEVAKKMQSEAGNLSNGVSEAAGRKVGAKAKREEDEDDAEWEEPQPTGRTKWLTAFFNNITYLIIC